MPSTVRQPPRFARGAAVALLAATCLSGCGSKNSGPVVPTRSWFTGDIHTHTWLSDGTQKQTVVLDNSLNRHGLDFIANSEHGGAFTHDPEGSLWSAVSPAPTFLGNPAAGRMWRWQSLRDYSHPLLRTLRAAYPTKTIIQGVEWNVPTHEHASVGIVDETDGVPVARFEYLFDQHDTGTTSDAELGISGKTASTTHQKAIDGLKWLQANYAGKSYALLNHPSRRLLYTIQDIRDLNDAAPDVCFGMEGFPGHQKEANRGGYIYSDPKQRTYGGADYLTATVGGVWDALLGEGRRFWIVVNSDFHDPSSTADFWPGEYAKTYVAATSNAAQNLVDGMRSGNMFAVQGDLINRLDFSVSDSLSAADMGSTLTTTASAATVTITFSSPPTNQHGDSPMVDHIDLIVGAVTGVRQDTNTTTRVVKTFRPADWGGATTGGTITFTLTGLSGKQYLRLRGTNLAVGVAGQTDAQGNPLMDNNGQSSNTAADAWADLWFYSNPVFIQKQ